MNHAMSYLYKAIGLANTSTVISTEAEKSRFSKFNFLPAVFI